MGVKQSYPMEIQIPSHHVALVVKMTEGDNDRLRLQELEALDEKRYKLNNTLSYIKLESQGSSTKKSKRESSKRETWS